MSIFTRWHPWAVLAAFVAFLFFVGWIGNAHAGCQQTCHWTYDGRWVCNSWCWGSDK